ncbi:hypothetical protein EYF80_051452 [Liparis tanakae]|uniref:Uncharacterized protein n=1 Tax=Liparis tanakae TaxID=230148 RepID=A0A4Z2FAX0_9TELE|nr:hypothetical protein EYF80_051452 [Liparis tanakae]
MLQALAAGSRSRFTRYCKVPKNRSVKPSCHSPQSIDIIYCNKKVLFHTLSPDGPPGARLLQSSASLCLTRVFNSLHLEGGLVMLFIVSQLHDRGNAVSAQSDSHTLGSIVGPPGNAGEKHRDHRDTGTETPGEKHRDRDTGTETPGEKHRDRDTGTEAPRVVFLSCDA